MAMVQQVSALSLFIGLPYGHQGSRQEEPKPSLFIQQHQSRAHQGNLKAISCICSTSCISGGTPDVSLQGQTLPWGWALAGTLQGTFRLWTGVSTDGLVLEAQNKNTCAQKRDTPAKPHVPAK